MEAKSFKGIDVIKAGIRKQSGSSDAGWAEGSGQDVQVTMEENVHSEVEMLQARGQICSEHMHSPGHCLSHGT